MRQNVRRHRRFRGQNMVEFALISPIFFFMFFAIIEGGWLLYNQNAITNAARDGARYAAVHGTESQGLSDPADVAAYTVDTDDVKAAIVKRLSISNPDSIQVTVSEPDGDMAPGNHVKITVSYRYIPLIGYVLGNKTINLSSSSTSVVFY
jgi:Flp pilus assembly protein TadG